MNDTDKVIIALGFFTLVGFISYLYFLKVAPATPLSEGVSVADLKQMREQRAQYVLAR